MKYMLELREQTNDNEPVVLAEGEIAVVLNTYQKTPGKIWILVPVSDWLTQLEEDIQTITFSLRELNTWKRNQVTRQLPERPVEKMPVEEDLEDEKDVG